MATQDTQIHTKHEGDICIGVHDDGEKRWLEFGDGGIQSIIDHNQPQDLASPVSQAMLAALLFTPTPTRFLLLGLGGGAIARYLSYRLPDCHGEAVELSPAVANIAQQFFGFSKKRWPLHQIDARDFVSQARANKLYDYVVLDIAEQQHTPDWLTELPFLQHCRQHLSKHGVLSINLIPKDAASFMQQLARIRQAFEARTLCLSVPEHRNILVFAFAQRPKFNDHTQLHDRANDLTQVWGLPFNDFLSRMILENPTGSGIF